MEARVDVRKLQVLNDRITQTIDALNQVRLSVHGLGHTAGIPPQLNPMTYMNQGYGFPQPQGFGAQGIFPGQQTPFQQTPFQGIPGISGFGLQHSPIFPGFGGPQTGLQGIPGITGIQQSPYQQLSPWVNPSVLNNPWGVSSGPWTGGGGAGGLFHSNPELIEYKLVEARASDPYRITQTFPFVTV